MAAVADLSEEEAYLFAILQDQSGIDQAEFTWTDHTSPDNVFRCWDFQYAWYRTRSKFQIDQCVAEGELVLTRRGHVPIEEVQVGDEVWTHRNRWRKVTYTWDKGEQDVVRVTSPLNSVGIVLTPDHKLWSRGGTRKMVAGHRSVHAEEPAFLAPQDFSKRAGEAYATMIASPHDFGCSSEVPKVELLPRCANHTVPDSYGEDFLWLCGIYVAEGTVRILDGKILDTVLSVHESEAEQVAKTAIKCGLTPRVVAENGEFKTHVRKVYLGGRSLAAYFQEHFGKLAHGKRLPTWALSLPVELRQALLDGLMFGDGHIRKTRRSDSLVGEYTTVSRALALDVKLLIQSLGRGANIRYARRVGQMQIQGRTVNVRDTYSVTQFVEGSRKNRIALVDQHMWAAYYDIVSAGQKRVYDLEVEEDHSFIAGGIAHSNCARAIGKSLGIQMRAFAFPFTNAGEEMLLTAPEMIFLDPVTKNVEDRILSARLSMEFLKRQGISNGIKHRPFEAHFRNGATILGRIPQKDGRGVKGSSVGDMLASTPSGLIRIDKLSVGDHVLTHEGRYMPILAIHGYEAETYQVTGAGHRGIQVSHNHRFHGRRNSNPQRTRNLGARTWAIVDDEELTERWYWATPIDFPALELPELPGEVQDPRAFAWLIGRYLADGNLNFDGGVEAGIPRSVYFTDDAAGIDEVRAMAQLAGFDPKDREHDNASCVAIHRTEFARFLFAHFGHRAEGKSLPAWVLGMARHLREDLLQGYLGGDGYWNQSHSRWEAGSASKELALGIKLLAQSLGYTCGFSWVDPKPNKICANPQRSHRVNISTKGRAISDEHLSWQRIRKVESAGTAMVYDLVVAEDFSYVADGIVHKGSSELVGWED